MFNEPSLTQLGSWRLTAVLKVTVETWIGNAAAVLSGTWGAVTRQAQHSGYSRTTVYTHAQRVVQAVASEQASGISYDALWQENERLKAENERLKGERGRSSGLKVSEKGGVSVYGLGRFPVTLYKEQWTKLLDMADEIRAFIKENEGRLKAKGE